MIQPILAVETPDYLMFPIKLLAVLGAATAGGFGVGWVAMAVVKLWLGQTIPRWPMWVIRSLGFILGGLLAYLWLFGVGGGGLGGAWGTGGTGQKDGGVIKKDDTARKDLDKEKEKPPKKDKDKDERDKSKVPPAQTLRIEVLGSMTVERITGMSPADKTKVYRIAGTTDLLTLEEVKKLVLKRKEDKPPLRRLEVIIYGDSPAADAGPVRELVQWARDLSLEVPAPYDEEGKAP